MPAFRVKLGANELNCVDVLLNHADSLCNSISAFSLEVALLLWDYVTAEQV